MNKKMLATLLISSILEMGCAKENWVDVGVGPEKIEEIPYRLIEMAGENKLPTTHSDLTSLTMSLQSGSSRGTWVYLPAYQCWAPKVRNGIPSVACTSLNGSDVIVGGTDNIREILLGLKADGKRAAIKGKVIGLYADLPVVLVTDPAVKRNSN